MTETTVTAYTDRDVYQLLLELAAYDVTVTALDFDPTDASGITCGDRRAMVGPSEDGSQLEWQLLRYPGRGRWRLMNNGQGDETAMRAAVVEHLRAADATL